MGPSSHHRATKNDTMLRYKPSQIHLTSADVGELDHRHAIHKERAFSDATTARLSAGPRLPTIIAAAHPGDGLRITWESQPRHQRRQTSSDVPVRAGRQVFCELPGSSRRMSERELDPGAPAFTPRVRFADKVLPAPPAKKTSPEPERRSRANAISETLPNLDRCPRLLPASPQENAVTTQLPSAPSFRNDPSPLRDAAAEFLRFRASPLDGLTAELSRLSTALGPASSTTEKRISLLNGSPFDTSSHENEIAAELLSDTPAEEADTLPLREPTSPAPPLSAGSPAQITTTPKVAVYNDATPARLQPQTPADLSRSSRRARNRSDSSTHREAFCVGQAVIAPGPPIPERRAYRNTYPATENITGVEEQLGEIEIERTVWSRRRQGRSLDVTPPGHGRFERFLD